MHNNYLPGRYVANGEDVTRNSHGDRHIDFSIATFGFCDQPQKISPSPCETNGVSGLSDKCRDNVFSSFREKNKACASAISGGCYATTNFSFESHKVNWLVTINFPSHFTSTNPILMSSAEANTVLALQKKGSYSCHLLLGNLASEELLWWMENLKLRNRRKIHQRKLHMTIQTEASAKGWEHTAREFPQWRNSHTKKNFFTKIF